ncbi:MAG: hypothetical protein FWE13_06105 [Firmicutes bacterium]|nr:hypothetical protein [Bacillota bacterium]
MNLTKLNKKSFYILAIVYIVAFINITAGMIYAFITLDAQIASMIAMYEDMGMGGMVSEEMIRSLFMIIGIIAIVIAGIYYGLVLYFVFSHRRKPRKGRYLIVILVFAILGLVFGGIGFIAMRSGSTFDLITSIIGLILNVAVIAGVVTQRQNPDPAYTHEDFQQPPYFPSEPFQ